MKQTAPGSILKETYELIKSLDKNEKRYFKLHTQFQRGDKSYLRLFEIMDLLPAFDEDKIIRKFTAHSKASSLPVIKKYLFEQLISSLKAFGAYKDLDSDHSEMIETYKVLRFKGLHHQASRLLRKAKEITMADDAFLRHYYILLLEYFHEMAYSEDPNATRLKELFEERRNVLKIIENYSWVSDIFSYQRALLRKKLYCRTKREKEELTELLAPLLEADEKDMLSRTASGMRNMALCEYYIAIGKPKRAIRESRIYLELRKNAGSADKTERQTIAEYAMYLDLCTRSRIYSGFEQRLRDYKAFVDTIRNREKFVQGYSRWIIPALVHLLHNGEAVQAKVLLEHESPTLIRLEKQFATKVTITIKYFTAYLYFAEGNLKASMKLVQQVISEIDDSMDEFMFARLLLMFIHFNSENFDVLEYQVRSAMRLLDRKDRPYVCESVLVTFFREAYSSTPTERKKKIKELKLTVDQLLKRPEERGFLYYFDIQSWIESKITGRPFLEVIASTVARKT